MSRRNKLALLGLALAICLVAGAFPRTVAAQSIVTPVQQILNILDFGHVSHSWSVSLPVEERFVDLASFNYEAVLDRNTGLVWDKVPRGTPRTWNDALLECLNEPIGGVKGWRLPSITELMSLVDPAYENPALPGGGSPFNNVIWLRNEYWSATPIVGDPTRAFTVHFSTGNAYTDTRNFTHMVWCVRGAVTAEAY